MPRSKDDNKYWYAEELLKTNLSIGEIRRQLTTLFGSAISPNQLLELKHELNKTSQKKKRKSFFSKKISPESVSDLSKSDIFNSIMEQMDKKFEEQRFLIFSKLQLFDKSLTQDLSVEIKNLRKDNAEKNFFQHYNNKKNTILEFLKRRTATFTEIVQQLGLSEDLTKLVIYDLENNSQLLLSVNAHEEVLYHKKPQDYQEKHPPLAEVTIALLEDPRIQLEVDDIKDALENAIRKEHHQLISEGKDERAPQLIYTALDQLTTKWKNVTHD